MPPGLVVVFVALQLCAGLKYLHVGLIEIKTHHSQSKKSAGVSNKKGFDASLPGFSGFPMPSGRRFLSRDYQRAFERAAQGNLLLLETKVLPLYRDLSMRLSHGTLVTLLPLPMISKPLQKGYTLLKTSTDERLSGLPTLYRREDDAKLLERASYYNHLHAVWPSVHFYVFPVPFVADWYAMAGLYGAGTEPHLAGDRYLRKFRTVLDPAIGYTWVAEGCSFQDAIAQYYRTDHHWNFPGAYKVYRQLWQLLHHKNPEIGPLLEPVRWIELPDLVFHGTWALRGGCCDALGDPIVDAVFELPELKVRIYGFEERERNAKRQYQAGKYAPGPFANHYAEYFGYDYGLIEYLCGDPCGASKSGNLLVISDSFDNGIEPLLASHFGRCWFVDLRHYAADVGAEFHLDDFLRQHQITDVLFLGDQYLTLRAGPNLYRSH